jgi:hypothetical protein
MLKTQFSLKLGSFAKKMGGSRPSMGAPRYAEPFANGKIGIAGSLFQKPATSHNTGPNLGFQIQRSASLLFASWLDELRVRISKGFCIEGICHLT